jgi:ATP-dependent DNA helicase RecQ
MYKEEDTMETKQKNGSEAVGCPGDQNLTEMALCALKTAVLTEGRYGMGYLIQLLTGDIEMKFRKPEHGSLETFGSLMHLSRYQAKEFLCFLIRKGLLYQSTGEYPLVRTSRVGKDFLEKPDDLFHRGEKIFPGKPELRLRYRLYDLREKIAQEEGKASRAVFTETTLLHLCIARPGSEQELLQVYGIGPWKVKQYGTRILEVIQSFQNQEKMRAVSRVFKSVVRPTFQETKALFEQGMDSHDIARMKGIKESTVRGYLEKLHLCGEIDVRAWIEKQVDRNTLHRAIRYFREAEDKRLSTAHEVLGLEMETLRLCRLYLQPPAALKDILVA